jgi:hypothetical protein
VGRKIKGWKGWAPVVITRYWLVQGMSYMNWTERAHRLTAETAFSLLAWWALGLVLNGWSRFLLAVVAGHTASMVFNGHLFALFKHDLCWFGFYKELPEFLAYVQRLQLRLLTRRPRGLARAEIYGSLTRGSFSQTSDLDLRFIARAGFANGFLVAHAVFVERMRASLSRFPLDLYMFHSEDELRAKMNVAKEKPLVIYGTDEGAQALSVTDLSRRVGGEISLAETLRAGAKARTRP